jgi:hypothetical protein
MEWKWMDRVQYQVHGGVRHQWVGRVVMIDRAVERQSGGGLQTQLLGEVGVRHLLNRDTNKKQWLT